MGRPIKVLQLSASDRVSLEEGYKFSPKPSYSRRCHIVLLKNKSFSSEQIAEIFDISKQSVNNWVKRFESKGLEGLKTKPGQGRPSILNKIEDAEKVKEIVKMERQRLKLAKATLETELNKEFSMKTLHRFLKLLAVPISESA